MTMKHVIKNDLQKPISIYAIDNGELFIHEDEPLKFSNVRLRTHYGYSYLGSGRSCFASSQVCGLIWIIVTDHYEIHGP